MSISSHSIPNLYKGIYFYIHDSLHPKVSQALSQLLLNYGATQCPPPQSDDPTTSRFDLNQITHFITPNLDFPELKLLQQINEEATNNDDNDGKGKGEGVIANVKGASVKDEKIKIVLPSWVTRSFDLQAIQQARFYSPDPSLFLSSTCICTTQLPVADDLLICSAVETFGGQWRRELTREVTHLVCVTEHGKPGDKYEMAIKFGTELGIAIVLPHWFEECLRLNRLVETDLYRFPSPPFTTTLRSTSSSASSSSVNKSFVERLNEYWKQRLSNQPSSSSSSANSTPPQSTPNTSTYKILGLEVGVQKNLTEVMREKEGYFRTSGLVGQIDAGINLGSQLGISNGSSNTQQQLNSQIASLGGGGKKKKGGCFEGKKVYLASDLGLSEGLLGTVRFRIEELGGEVRENYLSGETVEGSLSAGASLNTEGDSWGRRRKAERELRESDIVIMRNREGWEYWLAYELNLSIATPSWLFHTFLTSTCTSPLSKLTHYPPPSLYGIPAFRDKTITVSNYTGSARDYVRMLIEMSGAKYEGTMGKGTDYVVTASDLGSKCSHARTWSIPLVTHEWLESCVLTWSHLSPALSPTYTISTGQQYGMSYPNSLGEKGWTKEAVRRWADADERKEEREKGRRSVEELIRIEEEEKGGERMVMDEGKSTEVEGENGDEDDVEMETEEKSIKKPVKVSAVEERVVKEVPVIEVPPRSKEKSTSKKSLSEKGKEKEVTKPISKTKSKKPRPLEDDVMDVDQVQDESTPAPESARPRSRSKPVPNPAKTVSPPPFPPRAETPEQPTRKKNSTTKPSKLSKETRPVESTKENQDENGSSALSEADDDDDGSNSSSSSSNLPPSAKAMSKHFNQIDSHNLVQPGSKRAAAGKARAALHVAMEDKNKFELEQKSSAKKTGLGPRRSSQGLGPKEGASSPIKKRKVKREEGRDDEEDDLVKDVNDENEEEKPVIKKGRGKAKAKREITEDAEVEEEMPKKKAKVAVNKNLKNVTTQDGTTQEGAVSSFDNPPKAKPAPVKSNKLRIISTGLGLDKTSTEIKALKSLGVVWTDKPQEATHLVVKGLSRTEKFLCCLPFTPFIVTKKWIDACIDAGTLVDEAPYLLKDKKKELDLGDTLEAILSRAKKGKMLEGRKIYITKGVNPEVAVMQRIIAACGGIIAPNDLIKQHKKIISDPTALVVSSPGDRREWEKLSSEGIPIYTVEAVFVAAMHQQVEKGFSSANRVDPQLTA